MSRHAIRKQVFLLLFRTEFHNAEEMPEQERLFFLQDDIEDTYKGTDIWAEEEEEPDTDEKRLDDESEKEVSERFHAIQEALPEIDKELNTKDRLFTFLCGHDSNLGSVLASLDVEDYSLPGTIEKKTPIGAKLVFGRWKNKAGEEMISLDIVYQKTQQLKNPGLLGTDNPPGIYSLRLKGLEADENGLYRAEDFLKRLTDAIEAYDDLMERYKIKEAA